MNKYYIIVESGSREILVISKSVSISWNGVQYLFISRGTVFVMG